MPKRVYVTKAQTRAAGKLVSRSAITGRFVSPSVQKIAKAQPARSANGHRQVGRADQNLWP